MKAALIALTASLVGLLGVGSCGLFVAAALLDGSAVARPSTQARADIPQMALDAYVAAAATCPGLSWTVLAGIGKVESDHGRSGLPGVHSGQNPAGAMGPMQFLAATWDAYHLPQMPDVYDLRDAAFAAARYLCANGAGRPAGLRQAIWLYNHAWWYVDQVLSWAAAYATSPAADAVGGAVGPGDPFVGACAPTVTQPYGPTSVPSEPLIGGVRFHTGIDLACPAGTPVHSLTDGQALVTLGWGGGYGDNVVVEALVRLPGDLVPQRYFIRYAHLGAVAVQDGAAVHSGDILGLEGSTGNSTGPHLHFEVDRGQALATASVNPAPLLGVG